MGIELSNFCFEKRKVDFEKNILTFLVKSRLLWKVQNQGRGVQEEYMRGALQKAL